MILDENNRILYLKDKKVRLSKYQNRVLSYLIQKNKHAKIDDIINNVYLEEKTNCPEFYYNSLRQLIWKLNKKTFPYFKIVYRRKIGYCYIKIIS
jgi:DNA-binding winged helix-turn-helix (wHTH) protein